MFQPIATENLETFSYQLRCRICSLGMSKWFHTYSNVLKMRQNALNRCFCTLLWQSIYWTYSHPAFLFLSSILPLGSYTPWTYNNRWSK